MKISKYTGAVLAPNEELGKFIAKYLTSIDLPSEYMESEGLNLNKKCVKVLTLHNSKGLEFPLVAIVGLREGVFPKTISVDDLEEKGQIIKQERQLFYVGCSRAMRGLLICGSSSSPSQFLTSLKTSKGYKEYWDESK